MPSFSPDLWPAPQVTGQLRWTQRVPGSKSMTNRALVLAALADGPSQLIGALCSRDTDLMAAALSGLGAKIRGSEQYTGSDSTTLSVEPGQLHGGTVDCGLAGTVMRFVPPVAATTPAGCHIVFDGDAQARRRPMREILQALRALGVAVDGAGLPCTVHGGGARGGKVTIDASGSSQFVSGLLLSAPRFTEGIQVHHQGPQLPSVPHIDMTVSMLRAAGADVKVAADGHTWRVAPGKLQGRTWVIEPDLSNAAPFLAAAAVSGGTVLVVGWPRSTDQPGDRMREILAAMGAQVRFVRSDDPDHDQDLSVTGPEAGTLTGIDINMRDIGELAPTVSALAALATTPSRLTGIAHLRGHETDRLKALSCELTGLGGNCVETPDGLEIEPAALHGGVWHSYADHRMATAGAILGLRVGGVFVEDIQTTAKTLPGFQLMWQAMVDGTARG